MDGNARWAKKNKVAIKEGYLKGLDKINEIVGICIENKVQYLTLFALSTENIKRSSVGIIFEILNNQYTKIFNQLSKNNIIKIKIIGEKKNLPKNIINKLKNLENQTSKNEIINLNIAFNYGFVNELLQLIKKIVQLKSNKKIIINERLIRKNLYLPNTPDPDIFIRTGGFNRLSNFFLLQLSYSELFFTKTLWPEFSRREILNIFKQFSSTKRKYGL